MEYIKRTQPLFDTLTIDNCHDYLARNQLDFVQISHEEYSKRPTYLGDTTELILDFDFRSSWNGIHVSLDKREDGHFMNVGMHMAMEGYIGTYAISENHYRNLIQLAKDNDYVANVRAIFAESIDFVDFSRRVGQATVRVDAQLPTSEFFRKFFGLDDIFMQQIIADIYFWL
ncbi:hypothetical protein ACE3JD_25140 [Enterobacter hormaechei subsp. steigerwaltii]|uniref:Uncharacterized protein n=4 Tax=Enterobacterales TaxID=91347 RepID=A0AAQ0JAT2_ENTAS|nr:MULTISPECIES: hypothetical protein [Enterobacteriaceae]HAS0789488.1 hypothetical protein [Enterobacter hormaechei subsp. xiangfangensis]HCU0694783.1 hypothetical protein [Enterobacter hormaechei]KVK26976.1 hypothetical protein AWS15_10640 [Enterobacter hormaechei subsp. steigerwaltii]QYD29462.1 hypothetical protein KZX48_23965 [Enterobacter asburiae]UHA81055.1 hypothetical protein pKpnC6_00087 [Klebsiella pneumoniae]